MPTLASLWTVSTGSLAQFVRNVFTTFVQICNQKKKKKPKLAYDHTKSSHLLLINLDLQMYMLQVVDI